MYHYSIDHQRLTDIRYNYRGQSHWNILLKNKNSGPEFVIVLPIYHSQSILQKLAILLMEKHRTVACHPSSKIWTPFGWLQTKVYLWELPTSKNWSAQSLHKHSICYPRLWNCPDSDYKITEQNALRAIMFRPELAGIARCKITTTLEYSKKIPTKIKNFLKIFLFLGLITILS